MSSGGWMRLIWFPLVCTVIMSVLIGRSMKKCREWDIDNKHVEGKTILVTGANSGIGFYTSEFLALREAKVILGCRSDSKCAEAKSIILKKDANAKVDTVNLDLTSFKSIAAAVNAIKYKVSRLDVLINNAAIMAQPTREVISETGLEAQIGTNHFGHFLLTALLYPLLSKQGGRIINHSSDAHNFARWTDKASFLDDWNANESYNSWVQYGNSKASNLLFTYQLNELFAAKNVNVSAIAIHPGYTATNLQAGKFPLWEKANQYIAQTVREGSLSQIMAAVDPQMQPSRGTIFGPEWRVWGFPVHAKTDKFHPERMKLLWETSEKITKTTFKI